MTTHAVTETAVATDRDPQPSRRRATSPAAGNGLPGGLPTEANHIVHAHVLARTIQRLQAKYSPTLDGELIRHTVISAYRTLNQTARLKTYLPVIAARHAEDRLRAVAADVTARPEATSDVAMAAPAAA
jgi:hypothetical protein